MIGIISALGALSGILGSLSFPILRKKLGKCGVGNFGFGFETVCLILCVLSIFMVGSPFRSNGPSEMLTTTESSDIFKNSTEQQKEGSSDLTSVIVFVVGVVISRFGEFFGLQMIEKLQKNSYGSGYCFLRIMDC